MHVAWGLWPLRVGVRGDWGLKLCSGNKSLTPRRGVSVIWALLVSTGPSCWKEHTCGCSHCHETGNVLELFVCAKRIADCMQVWKYNCFYEGKLWTKTTAGSKNSETCSFFVFFFKIQRSAYTPTRLHHTLESCFPAHTLFYGFLMIVRGSVTVNEQKCEMQWLMKTWWRSNTTESLFKGFKTHKCGAGEV